MTDQEDSLLANITSAQIAIVGNATLELADLYWRKVVQCQKTYPFLDGSFGLKAHSGADEGT